MKWEKNDKKAKRMIKDKQKKIKIDRIAIKMKLSENTHKKSYKKWTRKREK